MSNPTTGMDLKLERTRRRVKAMDLANAMGVTSSRISTIENLAAVTPDAAERYRAALSTLTTVPSSPTAQEVA